MLSSLPLTFFRPHPALLLSSAFLAILKAPLPLSRQRSDLWRLRFLFFLFLYMPHTYILSLPLHVLLPHPRILDPDSVTYMYLRFCFPFPFLPFTFYRSPVPCTLIKIIRPHFHRPQALNAFHHHAILLQSRALSRCLLSPAILSRASPTRIVFHSAPIYTAACPATLLTRLFPVRSFISSPPTSLYTPNRIIVPHIQFPLYISHPCRSARSLKFTFPPIPRVLHTHYSCSTSALRPLYMHAHCPPPHQ
ncbi:hypothetical protein R3P38DRAFT_927977 [Favolaschia claudopus]|uniref:Uncharacterized protein n=1 Tax=Favolaschia claudopus TaxID=2862362 RepID=A0AAW0BPV8_9AGAR